MIDMLAVGNRVIVSRLPAVPYDDVDAFYGTLRHEPLAERARGRVVRWG